MEENSISFKKCKGVLFRASVSHYSNEYERGRNAGQINIGYNIKLVRLKKHSCPGCDLCGWIYEILPEIDLDTFSIDNITDVKNKRVYQLKGSFSGSGLLGFAQVDVDLDYLYLEEVKEPKMITYRKKGNIITVYLSQKKVGSIRMVAGGYKYFPWRSDQGGETFKTVEECKQSLEEE